MTDNFLMAWMTVERHEPEARELVVLKERPAERNAVEDERAEWAHFLDGFDHRHIAAWRDVEVTLENPLAAPAEAG